MFNLKEFVKELRENPEKKEIIENYEKYVESLENYESIYDTKIYKEYLKNFDKEKIEFIVSKLKIPEFIDEDEFDWELLILLVVSSFSSTWEFEVDFEIKKLSLVINVKAGDRYIKKRLEDLWGFQIAGMYEIYIEEQINLLALSKENKNKKKIVGNDRDERLKYFEKEFTRVNYIFEILKEEDV